MSKQTEQAMLAAIQAHVEDESGETVEKFHGVKLRAIAAVNIPETEHYPAGVEEYRALRYVSTDHPLVVAALEAPDRGPGWSDYQVRNYTR